MSESLSQYSCILENEDVLFFEGLAEMLEEKVGESCTQYRYRNTYGLKEAYRFGGVSLCNQCKEKWRAYIEGLHARIRGSFPEIGDTIRNGRLQDAASR